MDIKIARTITKVKEFHGGIGSLNTNIKSKDAYGHRIKAEKSVDITLLKNSNGHLNIDIRTDDRENLKANETPKTSKPLFLTVNGWSYTLDSNNMIVRVK